VLGRLALVLGVAGGVATGAGSARADDVAPMWMRAELAGTSARLVAHFEFDVEGGMHEELMAPELPTDGIVTGAVVSANGVTRRLALEPADVAAQQIEEVFHGEAGEDEPWVVRIATSGRVVVLDLGAPTSSHVALDLEVESPTCFFHDQRFVEIPFAWADQHDRALGDTGKQDAFATACGDAAAWHAFPDRALARRHPGGDRVGAITARLPLAREDLATVELAIAGELGVVPADLHTAIVVDASRSLTDHRARAQRAIVAAYLRAAPHGQVQVIGFARDAHALLPDWSDATAAAPAIDGALAALAPRNGSNLDAGLAEAATWLARVHGTRRIIVLTDELVPHRLETIDQTALARSLPDRTLVHVVALDNQDDVELVRADDALFAPLAAATFGMAVRAATNAQLAADATMLARPTSFDNVAISGTGWSQRDFPCAGSSVAEGTSCTWLASGAASAGRVVVAGDIWGRHVERVVELDRGEARTLARTLSARHAFADDEQAEIDRAAEAVNDAWALFVQWGGGDSYGDHPPSGFGIGLGGTSTSSHCGGFGVGHRNPLLDLRGQLAPVLARCGAPHAHVALDLELTRDEIVAVAATVSGDGATPALHDCLVEATWQTLLELPYITEHQDVHVDLR
jgi:hypothetical protein